MSLPGIAQGLDALENSRITYTIDIEKNNNINCDYISQETRIVLYTVLVIILIIGVIWLVNRERKKIYIDENIYQDHDPILPIIYSSFL